jgi:ACT domain-containing protein
MANLFLFIYLIQNHYYFVKDLKSNGVKRMKQRRAIVSVIGKDQVGIIAKVTNVLADNQINILDISQTILQDFFTMMMLVDLTEIKDLESLQNQFTEIGNDMNLNINVQLEDIFQSMHRV